MKTIQTFFLAFVAMFAVATEKSFADINLVPYKPSGWSDKIVISRSTGNHTDSSSLTTLDNLYIDWAVLNDGSDSTAVAFITEIYVDDAPQPIAAFSTPAPLRGGSSDSYSDFPIGKLGAGSHKIRIKIDATNVISETRGTDNEYTKTINVDAPNLTPYERNGWSDEIVVSKEKGNHTDSNSLTPSDDLYVDWSVINGGNVATNVLFYTQLYIDGVPKHMFDTPQSLKEGDIASFSDFPIGKLPAGTHTISILTDSTNVIEESRGTDNEFTKTITVAVPLPNLVPHKPSGWSDKIVVSKSTGTNTNSSSLKPSDNLYVDWALLNDSRVTVTRSFVTEFYVDDVHKDTFTTNPPLHGGQDSAKQDIPIGKLSAGTHTIRIKIDPDKLVEETRGTDNEFTKTITVGSPSGSSSVSGLVSNQQSGARLGNVTVILASGALGSYTQKTNSNGYYSFTGLSAGAYTLSASLTNYAASSQNVTLSNTLTKNISLTPDFNNNPTSTFSGYLRDATNGLIIPQAGKTIAMSNGTSRVTDTNGYFSFSSFPSGSYTVSVSSPPSGYLKYSQKITFNGASTGSIYLTINKTLLGAKTDSGYSDDPVNTATGNYLYNKIDLKLPGPGMNFVFERNYNAQDASSTDLTGLPLGFGWNHSYNISLTVNSTNNVAIRWGDSKTDTYSPDGNGGFIPQPGFALFDTLTAKAEGGYALTRKDQTVYHFDVSNRLASIVDKNGNTTALNYTGTNLTSVTDTAGRIISFTYDASNRMTKITDPLNRTIQFAYDANGNLISSKDANGKTIAFTYDASHQVLTVVDARGNTLVTNTYDADKRVVTSQKDAKQGQTTFVYDEVNQKTTVTLPLGRVTVDHFDNLRRLVRQDDALGNSTFYTYDEAGNRDSVINKNGYTTTYSYDPVGNVTGKSVQLGGTTAITYDAKNNPVTRTDELGNTTQFQYDAKGNLNKTIDALGNFASATYSANGWPLTMTDALLNKTTLAYDGQGNLASTTDALNNATTSTYDAAGRRLTTKDALNRVTTLVYDNNDNVLSVTDPALKTASFTYDGNNNKLSETDKRGKTTSYTYDVKDLLVTVTNPLGGVLTNTYDALDQKTGVTNARGATTQYAYDLVGNLTGVTDALGKATLYTYDANGNRLSVKNPLGNTSFFAYDALDRLIQTKDSLNNLTQTEYDALGRRTKVTDANNKATAYLYDLLGRLTQATDANNGTVLYTYDAAGNRKTMTDPNNHVTTYIYDTLNRLTQIKDPSNGIYLNTYDAVGNLLSRRDPKGSTILYICDANNRRTRITYPSGAPVTFTYDANGNRTSMTDSLGASTYQYDDLNRLTSATDAYGKTVAYAYDANGNRTSMTYPGNKTVTYAYDADNRMKSVTDWFTRVTAYTYDDAGALTATANPNGTTAAYAYDTAGRLTGLANAKADQSVISNYSLTLDGVGNHTQSVQNEPLLPIIAPQNVSYAYDNDNRLTTAGAAACTYDANGNLTARGADTYSYDFENWLTQDSIGGTTSQYQYDGTGNRKQAVTAAGTKRFVLDLNGSLSHVLSETDGSGNANAYYIYGRGLVSRLATDGTALYYHYDVRGSTIALSNAAGNLTDQYAYDPFGKIANSQGASTNPFKYVGKYGVMDEGNGLAYMRARYFSPDLGRFITKDPLTGTDGDSQSLHRYMYALNNPVIMIDVSGLYSVSGFFDDIKEFGKSLFADNVEAVVRATGGGISFAWKEGYRSVHQFQGAIIGRTGKLMPLDRVHNVVADFTVNKLLDAIEGPGISPPWYVSWIPYVDQVFRYHEAGRGSDEPSGYSITESGDVIDASGKVVKESGNPQNGPLIPEVKEINDYKTRKCKK